MRNINRNNKFSFLNPKLISIFLLWLIYFFVNKFFIKDYQKQPALEECSDLDLVYGPEPTAAGVVIFGDLHQFIPCASSISKCMKALAKISPAKEVVVLIEDVPFNKFTTCKTQPNFKFFDLTSNCKGWNDPSSLEYHDAITVLGGLELLFKQLGDFSEQKNKLRAQGIYPIDPMQMLLDFLIGKIKEYEKKIEQLEAQQNEELYAYNKNHGHHVHLADFQFSGYGRLDSFKAHLKIYSSSYNAFSKNIRKAIDGLTLGEAHELAKQRYIKLGDDYNYFFRIPNKSLVNTIRKEANDRTLLFGVAGRDHVLANKKGYKEEQAEIVKELYHQLDTMPDKDPVSILTCRG